jgi:hypothetical protein
MGMPSSISSSMSARLGLAADGALLGVAVVDAAGFGEALAHVFRLAGGAAQGFDEPRGDGGRVGLGQRGRRMGAVCT